MTSHELARKLLEGPDLPVALTVSCDDDAVSGVDRLDVHLGTYTEDGVDVHYGEAQPQGPAATFVLLGVKSEKQFLAEVFEDDEGDSLEEEDEVEDDVEEALFEDEDDC